ncbi:DNA alkylation repair protein [Arthrobacter sp. H20]|uniref:DNA alkylation repair protein n=1 Tax=Arthrobacter sp. H20 TaxID=1267981 RepID=UPI0020A62194|nr:DNA alkylation repair protein [Arthrobacter sp. H20]
MSDAGEFVDAALQREASWERAEDRGSDGLQFYGSTVGAVRGTVRDALRRHRELDHDAVLALSSELWSLPIFERRLAAIVVLQSKLDLLRVTDLTRLEGFLRQASRRELVDPLALDVVGPLIDRLGPRDADRAVVVLDRWAADGDHWLSRAALLSPLRPLRTVVAIGMALCAARGQPPHRVGTGVLQTSLVKQWHGSLRRWQWPGRN